MKEITFDDFPKYKPRESESDPPNHPYVNLFDKFVDGTFHSPYNIRRQMLQHYQKRTGLKGFCLLDAHGDCLLRKPLSRKMLLKQNRNVLFKWVYWDDIKIPEERRSVQEWIDERDGRYLALVLAVCNPLNLDVMSRSSVLLFPDNDYVENEQGWNRSCGSEVRMFIPGRGYLNDEPERKMGTATIREFLRAII